MITLENIIENINEYCKKYHLNVISENYWKNIYCLFPKEVDDSSYTAYWPSSYNSINGDKPGIYIILGKQMNVLYIGKASLNNRINKRLASYFKYEKVGKGCHVNHSNWTEKPYYIVGFPVEFPYEASSLEEYLLSKSLPPDNKIGLQQQITDCQLHTT